MIKKLFSKKQSDEKENNKTFQVVSVTKYVNEHVSYRTGTLSESVSLYVVVWTPVTISRFFGKDTLTFKELYRYVEDAESGVEVRLAEEDVYTSTMSVSKSYVIFDGENVRNLIPLKFLIDASETEETATKQFTGSWKLTDDSEVRKNPNYKEPLTVDNSALILQKLRERRQREILRRIEALGD
jgi:hypothetical protein